MQRIHQTTGVILYEGPSLIDGSPIVVVATGLARRSKNGKTGRMIQVWIMPAGVKPNEAVASGADRSVCGDCPHRPLKGNTCYVNLRAPINVFKALGRGRYPRFDREQHLPLFRGRKVRLGAWGDPAAAPLDVFIPILLAADGHSGYTHQYASCDPAWARFVMASTEYENQAPAGWRTFRVRAKGAPLAPGEKAGKRRTCETCLACDGATASGRGASPSIEVHGGGAAHASLARRFSLTVLKGAGDAAALAVR